MRFYAAFKPGHMSPGNMYPGRATCIRIHISRRTHVADTRYMSTATSGHKSGNMYPGVNAALVVDSVDFAVCFSHLYTGLAHCVEKSHSVPASYSAIHAYSHVSLTCAAFIYYTVFLHFPGTAFSVSHFPSCIFHLCSLILYFPVLHFPPPQFDPSFSSSAFPGPAFSAVLRWSYTATHQ